MEKVMVQVPSRNLALLGFAALLLFTPTAYPQSDYGTIVGFVHDPSGGVMLGFQCYSFRDRPLDAVIQAMVEIGCGECEMNYVHLEPPALRNQRERLREWRLSVPLEVFEKAGRQVRAAGIDPWAYTYNMKADFTDAEMARGFEMTRALGARAIVSSPNLTSVKRIDAMARKYKMRVALHNHSRVSQDELATPDDFAAAIKGVSDYLGLALGHEYVV